MAHDKRSPYRARAGCERDYGHEKPRGRRRTGPTTGWIWLASLLRSRWYESQTSPSMPPAEEPSLPEPVRRLGSDCRWDAARSPKQQRAASTHVCASGTLSRTKPRGQTDCQSAIVVWTVWRADGRGARRRRERFSVLSKVDRQAARPASRITVEPGSVCCGLHPLS